MKKNIAIVFLAVAIVFALPLQVVNADAPLVESSTSKSREWLGSAAIHYSDGSMREIKIPVNGINIQNESSLKADVEIHINQTVILLAFGHYEVFVYPEITEMRMSLREGITILPLERGCKAIQGLTPMDYYDGLYADYYCQQ